jgi:hypothetical protein
LASTISCGDDDDGGDDDTTTIDATASTIDSAASTTDAPPAATDASGVDALSTIDATPPVDADLCGAIGMTCTDEDVSCPGGLECMSSTGGMFCTKTRPGCGGFAGATCDDPSAPLCHFLSGADFGPCLSAFERDCICDRSPGSITGCP